MKKVVSIKLMRAKVEELIKENDLGKAYDLTLQIRSINNQVKMERDYLALIIEACSENIEVNNVEVYLNACEKLRIKPEEEIVEKFLDATLKKGHFYYFKILANILGKEISPEMLRQIIRNDITVLDYHIQEIETMFNSEQELNDFVELVISDLVESGDYYDALWVINFIGRKPTVEELRKLSDKAISDDDKMIIDMDINRLEK